MDRGLNPMSAIPDLQKRSLDYFIDQAGSAVLMYFKFYFFYKLKEHRSWKAKQHLKLLVPTVYHGVFWYSGGLVVCFK